MAWDAPNVLVEKNNVKKVMDPNAGFQEDVMEL